MKSKDTANIIQNRKEMQPLLKYDLFHEQICKLKVKLTSVLTFQEKGRANLADHG